jgi:hypothetical protein
LAGGKILILQCGIRRYVATLLHERLAEAFALRKGAATSLQQAVRRTLARTLLATLQLQFLYVIDWELLCLLYLFSLHCGLLLE